MTYSDSGAEMNLHEGKRKLGEWLELCRQSLADTATKLGYATQVEVHVPHVSFKAGGNGSTAKWVLIKRNGLDVIRAQFDIFNESKLPRGAIDEIAETFHREFGQRCKFWHSEQAWQLIDGLEQGPIDFDQAPVKWVIARALAPCALEYARRCEDFGKPSVAACEKVIEELCAFLGGETWTVVDRIPLAGLLAKDVLDDGASLLRPMDPIEAGKWAPGTGKVFHDDDLGRDSAGVRPSHMLEVRSVIPKTEGQARGRGMVLPSLTALQLLGYQPAGAEYESEHFEPGWLYSGGGKGSPVWLPPYDRPKVITAPDFAEVVNLASKMKVSALHSPSSQQDVALHRFHLAMSRLHAPDKLIDLTIALEALLLSGDKAELTYRFRLNGANWLGEDSADRQRIFDQLKTIYETRSAIVHGAKFPESRELQDAVDFALPLTAKALRKGLVSGWPKREDFQKMAMNL